MSINARTNVSISSLKSAIGDVGLYPHSHTVQFYGDDDFLLDELQRFTGSALEDGDAVVIIATRAHRDGLIHRLTAGGIDTGGARAQGRYISLDAGETLSSFMVDGRPDAALFNGVIGDVIRSATAAAKGSRPRVAAFGEMVALLWAGGNPEAASELEQLWNNLALSFSFDLLCGYPMSLFGRSADTVPVEEIIASHSHVLPAESYTALADEQERLRAVTILQQKAQALDTEIEEHRKSQNSLTRTKAELADFLDNALEGVQQVGADGIIMWANRALLSLLGYSAGEYVGYPLSKFMHDSGTFEEFWGKLLRREDNYDYPAEFRCKDGSIKHVLIHSNGLWENGQFIHTRCFIRDVTEHNRMEQALIQSNQELREAVATRDQFLSIAAHELKTPLTSLRGFTQLLLRNVGSSPERLQTALEAIQRQTQKLNDLVSRLLDSAQIEAGKLRINFRAADIAALVRSALAQQYGAGHTFAYVGPEHLQASVDPVRFEQVVANLLENAVKFSPQGGVVTVELSQDSEGATRLSITDQGVGIPGKERENVFSRFYQAHGEHHLSGMGLGLYISREIVDLHGGSVWIEGPEQGGTRFVISLPPRAGTAS